MPLIGSLGQISLSIVLQRIEVYAKTGLLIVKQGENSVELSFRQGQLMCIGPIRTMRTLGDRLLEAGVISQEAYLEAVRALGASPQSETRTAIAFIDLGFVNQKSLYTLAMQEASRVLQVLLTWTTGEIYFEEGLQPPADRLLVALSVISLLPQRFSASTRPVSDDVSSMLVQEQPKLRAPAPAISDARTLHSASQFFDADAFASISSSPGSLEDPATDVVRKSEALSHPTVTLSPPQRVTKPIVPRRIDTSFMQPQMVLIPRDLSGLREQNPKIQITPEQWCLFTRADGQTSLQMACQVLMMPPELVCLVAGELIALGLVTISMPGSGSANETVPIPQDFIYSDLSNSYVTPANDYGNNPFALAAAPPIETQSQWGNGGNGATFVLGGGWVVSASPSNPLQPSGPLSLSNKVYAQPGGRH